MKQVYIIIPLDENGKAIGAYVGKTGSISVRLRQHYYSKKKTGKQTELHELMKTNHFICLQVDQIKDPIRDGHLEYDWMDFVGNVIGLKLFNENLGNGDYKKISCLIKNLDKSVIHQTLHS